MATEAPHIKIGLPIHPKKFDNLQVLTLFDVLDIFNNNFCQSFAFFEIFWYSFFFVKFDIFDIYEILKYFDNFVIFKNIDICYISENGLYIYKYKPSNLLILDEVLLKAILKRNFDTNHFDKLKLFNIFLPSGKCGYP